MVERKHVACPVALLGGMLVVCLAAGVSVPAQEAVAAPVSSATGAEVPLDLLALTFSLPSAQVQATQADARIPVVWSVYTQLQPTGKSVGRIVPPYPIGVGKFAGAHFRGPQANWAGYDTLVLHILCDEPGTLSLHLSEYDGEQREDFSYRWGDLTAGSQTLRVRLAPVPEGDLEPSPILRDGAWNPDEQHGVDLLLPAYPPGFVITGLFLERAAEEGN